MTRFRFLLAAVLAAVSLWTATPAGANLSSGLPAGPVGTPVISSAAEVAAAGVLVTGDSITVRSYKELAAQLTVPLAVNAQSGRNTKQSIDSLFTQMQGKTWPAVLVMATGSNDVFAAGSMPAQIRRLLAGVPESTRVYWVNVRVARPGFLFADRVNTAHVNEAIRLGCTGRCTVISWAGFLAGKAYRPATYIDKGGVHPSLAGEKAWGALIAGSIK